VPVNIGRDIWHVYDYVVDYEDQVISGQFNNLEDVEINFSKSLGMVEDPLNMGSNDLEEIMRNNRNSYVMSQTQFFKAIFMLCVGFMVALWGLVRFYFFFDHLQINKRLDRLESKVLRGKKEK
jgi:hypothetical protein